MLFSNHQFILASKSPRRKQLLSELGLDFEVISRETDESYPDGLSIEEIPKHIARCKAEAVYNYIGETEKNIIAADTIVAVDTKILGKPKDKNQAIEFIQLLQGRSHKVITGVCLKAGGRESCFQETTLVGFGVLSIEEIAYYVDTYKPFDKAGAYAIQEWIGLVGIRKIEGCYYNVVGFPTHRFVEEFKSFTS